MNPGDAVWNFTASRSEMALVATDTGHTAQQILTMTRLAAVNVSQGCSAMEGGAGAIYPWLTQDVVGSYMAVMTGVWTVGIEAIDGMALIADGAGIRKCFCVVGDGPVNPGFTQGDFASSLVKMALEATDACQATLQIRTVTGSTASKVRRGGSAVEGRDFFVQPSLTEWVICYRVAVVTCIWALAGVLA